MENVTLVEIKKENQTNKKQKKIEDGQTIDFSKEETNKTEEETNKSEKKFYNETGKV